MSSPLQRDRAIEGLTLVELLTVVAIISILTGLLVPVFSRGKEQALMASSMSHLHQLGFACSEYAIDSDDYLPPYQNNEVLLSDLDPTVTTNSLPTNSSDPRLLKESLLPYLGQSAPVWFCPLDEFKGTNSVFGSVNHLFTSYLFIAKPEGFIYDSSTQWPIQVSLTAMLPPGGLFQEPKAIVDRSLHSYWSAPISQAVFEDGSVHKFH